MRSSAGVFIINQLVGEKCGFSGAHVTCKVAWPQLNNGSELLIFRGSYILFADTGLGALQISLLTPTLWDGKIQRNWASRLSLTWPGVVLGHLRARLRQESYAPLRLFRRHRSLFLFAYPRTGCSRAHTSRAKRVCADTSSDTCASDGVPRQWRLASLLRNPPDQLELIDMELARDHGIE